MAPAICFLADVRRDRDPFRLAVTSLAASPVETPHLGTIAVILRNGVLPPILTGKVPNQYEGGYPQLAC